MIKHEGARSLYKGLASPLLTVGILNSAIFTSYGLAERAFGGSSLGEIFRAGMISGLVSCFISSPVELVKSKLQVQRGGNRGMLACTVDLCRKGGLLGLYQGMSATLGRDVFSYGVYFTTYEGCRRTIARHRNSVDKLTPIDVAVAGGLGGCFAWTSIYPIDVVKTRMQTSEAGVWKHFFHCAGSCYKVGGAKVFFAGLWPTLLRAFPMNAVTFVVYEWAVKALSLI